MVQYFKTSCCKFSLWRKEKKHTIGVTILLLGSISISNATVTYIRIFQLQGIFKHHQIQAPDHFSTNQKLKHITMGIIQKPFENRQAWVINHLARKPVPVLNHSHGKEKSFKTGDFLLYNGMSHPKVYFENCLCSYASRTASVP